LSHLDTQGYTFTSVNERRRTIVQKIRPLAHPVASRFDDFGKGIILETCERLRRRKRLGTLIT
jgi:hypothetical protein